MNRGPRVVLGLCVWLGACQGDHSQPEQQQACPGIACNAGVSIKLSAPEPDSSYANARIKVCQNDHCKSGQLVSTIGERPGSGSGVGVYSATLFESVSIELTLWDNLPEQYLELGVRSWDPKTMRDGDRYVLELTSKDGKQLADLSETVDKYEIHEIGAPCTQYCPHKSFDLRDATGADADAGTS